MIQIFDVPDELAMMDLGQSLSQNWRAGDVVLLRGELGAGKTTLVRGVLKGFGINDPVRSPTFNLIQVFDTKPPVLHADLYRLTNTDGLGLDDYLETHLCLIEWPDRAEELVSDPTAIRVEILFTPSGRSVKVTHPE